MNRVRHASGVRRDIARLTRWYREKGHTPDHVIVAELKQVTDQLLHNPTQYAKVPGCPATRDVRITAAKKRKMIVIYETTGTEVVILSLSHKSVKRRPWRKRLEEV